MKRLLILVPVLFAGLYTAQDEKIEDYISQDSALVVKIGSLKKFYEGFAETGLGRLFTDKEIGDFFRGIPEAKKMLDDVNQKLSELEKELGAKLEDFIKSVEDVWMAAVNKKEPWAAAKFKNKDIAAKALNFFKSKDANSKYELRGSSVFFGGRNGEIPQKKADSKITSNGLYKSALSVIKPSDATLFVFVNIEILLKEANLGEKEKKLGVECFKYGTLGFRPDGKYISQKIHVGIDPTVKGLIPTLLQEVGGRASVKNIPASSLLALSSGLDLTKGLAKLEEYFEANDKDAFESLQSANAQLKLMTGVGLHQIVGLFNNLNLYVAPNKELKITDTVISLKTGDADVLGKLIKVLENLPEHSKFLSKKDTDTYKLVFPKSNGPNPLMYFDNLLVKKETLYLGGSVDLLKTHSGSKTASLEEDKEFKELIKGSEDASIIFYANWEGALNFVLEMFNPIAILFLKQQGIDTDKLPVKRIAQLLGRSVDCLKIEKNGVTLASRSNNILSICSPTIIAAIAIPGILTAQNKHKMPEEHDRLREKEEKHFPMILDDEGQDKKVDQELAKKIEQLIKELDSEDFDSREHAAKKLVEIGEPALEALENALKSKSAEVRDRAKDIIDKIDWLGSRTAVEKYVKENKEDELRKIDDELPQLKTFFKAYRFYQAWKKDSTAEYSTREYYVVKKRTSSFIKIDKMEDLFEFIKKEKASIILKDEDTVGELADILKMVLCRPKCTNGHTVTKTDNGWEIEVRGTHYRMTGDHRFKIELDKEKKLKSITHETISQEEKD